MQVKRVIKVCVCVCVSVSEREEGLEDGYVYIVWWFEQSSLLSARLSLSYTIRIGPPGESHYRLVIVNTASTP